MRKYMNESEIFDELDAVRSERAKAQAAFFWGAGHRARWYTDLDPLIVLLQAWHNVQGCNVHDLPWATLADKIPKGRDLLTEIRMSSDGDTSDLEEAAQDEYDRLVLEAERRALDLAIEVAEEMFKTLPERLAEEADEQGREDLAETLREMDPSAASHTAYNEKIFVDDQEGSKGVSNFNQGHPQGWALTRTWGDRESAVVEF